MSVIEIPTEPNSPVRVFGIPVMRFVLVTVIATIGHLTISGILSVGWFSFGMAAAGFNGSHYIGPSDGFLALLKLWTAGYSYLWIPIKAKILPPFPPYKDFPHSNSDQAFMAYRPYLNETVRIHHIWVTADIIAFISWATVCGLFVAWIDYARKRRSSGIA